MEKHEGLLGWDGVQARRRFGAEAAKGTAKGADAEVTEQIRGVRIFVVL